MEKMVQSRLPRTPQLPDEQLIRDSQVFSMFGCLAIIAE